MGAQPAPPKHFTLRRKPKSAALRAELFQKGTDNSLFLLVIAECYICAYSIHAQQATMTLFPISLKLHHYTVIHVSTVHDLAVCRLINGEGIRSVIWTLINLLSGLYHYQYGNPTDLKNRTGLSIYFWETEGNGGHIEGNT